jgi:DNA repair exonuclease SbcCD ATPase subunit
MLKPNVEFKRLTIKNGRTFRNLDVDLSGQGIISVVGANGTGKSSMFNILEAIFYGSTSTGHKKDNLVTFGDDAFFSVDLLIRGKPIRIEYNRVAGKWKHKVSVDGKAIGHHSVLEEAKEASQILGLSKKEFEGSVHLTQHASHVLISGLPSERKKYIAEFFDLDERWDTVLESAKAKLLSTRNEINKLSGLSHTIAALSAQLATIPDDDLTLLQQSIDKAKRELAETTKKRRAIVTATERWAAYVPLAEIFDLYESPSESMAENQEFVVGLERRLAKNKELRKQNREILCLIQLRLASEQEMANLLGRFPSIEKYNIEEHRSLHNLRASWDGQSAVRHEYQSLANVSHASTADLEQKIADLQGQLAYLGRRHKHANAGRCPECGQDFVGAAPSESDANELTAALTLANSQLASIRNNNRLASRKEALVSSITAKQPTEEQLARLRQQDQEAAVYQKFLQVRSVLANPVPILHDVEDDTNYQKKLDLLREEGQRINRLLRYHSQYGAGKPEEVAVNSLREVIAVSEKYEAIVDDCNRKLGIAQTNIATKKRLGLDIDKLQQEYNGLDGLKFHELFWKTMADAYGPKGLRVDAISRVMDVIIKRLPYNAARLFDDNDMSFSHVTDAGNVEILVSRLGKHPDTGELVRYEHDISSMSGGEARRLSVALVVTMAECVVNTKRTNMLILDEVDSNLDAIGKYKYINDFLPSLRGRWDTIFVISHDEDIQQAAIYDQTWKIEKRAGWSTLAVNDLRGQFSYAQTSALEPYV